MENFKPATPISQPKANPSGSTEAASTPPINPSGGGASPGAKPDVFSAGEGAKINIISPGAVPTGSPVAGGVGGGNQVGLGQLFEAKMALAVIDALLPALVVLAFHKGGMVVKKGDMQLTAKETETLAPVLQKCLDSVLLNFDSPWTALAVTALGIYGAKIMEHGGKAYHDKLEAAKKAPVKPLQAKSGGQPEAPPRHPQTQTGAVEVPVRPLYNEPESPDGPDRPADLPEGLAPWGPTELAKVKNRRKKGHDDAIKWLNDNWAKNGGVI